MTSPSGSTPAEAQAFLVGHPEIEAIDIVLTDSNGVGRGKIIRRHELMPLYEGGRHMPISVLGLDITGEDVHETGLIWDSGDGDLRAWPIPGTLKPLHGTSPARAQVLMSMYLLDGTPMTSDPRHALARQVARLDAMGLKPAGAFELEFFLLANDRDADGRVRPASAVVDGRRSGKTEVYSVDHLHGMEPLFSDIYAAAKAQDIPAETVISEYAPGQYELTLHYRTDIMQAADDLVMLKRIVRAAARRHGVTACFMAKPIEDYAGSGMHLHVSMTDRTGRNVFSEANGETWSLDLLRALGGLSATMAESMLVFAPHANSWRRFVSQSYAPIAPTWGVNNRTVSFRIPAGPPPSRHVEHRACGADANPYLAVAAVLAGMHHGMTNKTDPGAAVAGNGYDRDNSGDDKPPSNWFAAVDRFHGSTLMRDYLGERFVDMFSIVKRVEQDRYFGVVPTLDYDWYLRNA